jgi:hypothetical protein
VNPPDIDILVSQHFLRKKWKDPVTGEDFVPVGIGVGAPGSGTQSGTPGGQTPGRPSGGAPSGGTPLTNQNPGVSGVRSKSNATSIKLYEQQQQHSLWPFDGTTYRMRSGRNMPQQGQQPGQPPRGAPGTGGPPGSGGQPPRTGGPVGPGGAAGSGPPPPRPVPPGGAAGSGS